MYRLVSFRESFVVTVTENVFVSRAAVCVGTPCAVTLTGNNDRLRHAELRDRQKDVSNGVATACSLHRPKYKQRLQEPRRRG